MEAPEEVSLGAKDQTQIVKGKRTKRVRPQSPLPLSAIPDQDQGEDTKNSTATTSSAEFEENRVVNNNNNNNSSSSSTEEEEDMANCLILLAQGQSRESPKPTEEDGNTMTMMKSNINNNNSNYNYNSSRKFMEAATVGANKAGFYVYECKTCNKTFPSFQALGGHRASHKKPKASPPMAAIVDKEKKKEEDFILHRNNININNNTLSFQLLNSSGSNGNKNKVHECSICGAEFGSGQALGGHMRRHRAPIGTTTNTPLLTLNNNPVGLEADQYHNEDHHHQPRKKRNVLNLDLDLNLPAPEDDQNESSSFAFEPKQQQQQQASLVFSSAPALVDCHY